MQVSKALYKRMQGGDELEIDKHVDVNVYSLLKSNSSSDDANGQHLYSEIVYFLF